MAFDESIRQFVHAHASPPITLAMRGFSLFGQPALLIAICIGIMLWLALRGRTRKAILFGLSIAGAEILDQSLKLAFHRPRPAAFFGLPLPNTYSFPSGHALVSCVFFGMLAKLVAPRKYRTLYYAAGALITCAIGFSRVYLGVHYPTDVLGGYAFALGWLSIIAWARKSPRLQKPTPPARST